MIKYIYIYIYITFRWGDDNRALVSLGVAASSSFSAAGASAGGSLRMHGRILCIIKSCYTRL